MKKTALALFGATAFAVAAPAQAATVITLDDDGSGTLTGEFTASKTVAGAFSDTFTFTLPTGGFTGATVTTVAVTLAGNIDFSSITLNGVAFDLSPTGFSENAVIKLYTQPGEQTLVVSGTTGSNAGYGGVVTFAPGVPEPGTWLLMILGFGAIGGAMRYRRRKDVSVKTNYSFA